MISKNLTSFIESCIANFDSISDERKALLNHLTDYLQNHLNDSVINLTFICTHNSRRSHLAQVWAKEAAQHYSFSNASTFSGGTEATAVYPSVINALKIQGVSNETLGTLFSKTHDHKANPQSDFAAVMVCTDADDNCPFIPNSTRISLPYEDPKAFDGTDIQEAKYQERSSQIATELFYVFSKVNK